MQPYHILRVRNGLWCRAMMRVTYAPVPDRTTMLSVSLVDSVKWLVGYVHKADDGRWAARQRGDTADRVQSGFRDRSTAASYLLISSGFAQEPRPDRGAQA